MDSVARVINDQDDTYAAFKTNRHTNFKAGLINTLGVFEDGKLFEQVRRWQALVALIYQVGAGDLKEVGRLKEWQHEESKSGVSDVEQMMARVSQCASVLAGASKADGQPASEVAQSLLTAAKEPF